MTRSCRKSENMLKSTRGKAMETVCHSMSLFNHSQLLTTLQILNALAKALQLWQASHQRLYHRKYIKLLFPRHCPIPRFVLYPHHEAPLSQQTTTSRSSSAFSTGIWTGLDRIRNPSPFISSTPNTATTSTWTQSTYRRYNRLQQNEATCSDRYKHLLFKR